MPTQQVDKKAGKEIPAVKRYAWGKDFLAHGARGNELAAGAENYSA